ncbi:MAG: hypothetical protein Q7S50_02890 [bacterium]|nr:hypothetical protein [bacterium]
MFRRLIVWSRARAKNALFATFVPLAETPAGSKLGQLYTSNGDLSNFVNGLFKFAIAIGAIVAVLRIAYAGYLYMGAADMWSTKAEAKRILGEVTLGLLLLLAIYLILYQINPDILQLNAFKNVRPAL